MKIKTIRCMAFILAFLLIWAAELTVSAAPDMVLVQGGPFIMGDDSSDALESEKPSHQVTVNSFYVGKFEVTFDEYDAFCTATGRQEPSDANWGRGQRPVISISWYDALDYCNWLSQREGLTPVYSGQGNNVVYDSGASGYRLPTEKEWEYASKGGLKSRGYKYSGSDNIHSAAWYIGNSGNRTRLVGQKRANEWGIYDMSGNAAEWCWESYGSYAESGTNKNFGTDGDRVIRGGSWYSFASYVRSSARGGAAASSTSPYIGFRLARTER